jgi:hypothetical protein
MTLLSARGGSKDTPCCRRGRFRLDENGDAPSRGLTKQRPASYIA